MVGGQRGVTSPNVSLGTACTSLGTLNIDKVNLFLHINVITHIPSRSIFLIVIQSLLGKNGILIIFLHLETISTSIFIGANLAHKRLFKG